MKFPERIPCPHQFVVIEGNIGAGKTSLASKISQDYQAKLILERFADNPFLPKFYEDQERYAFSVELSFLADRYNQLKKDLQSRDLFSAFTIADYYFMKSLIFARNTLAEDEYKLYAQIFHIIYQSFPKPDLYVYLHASSEKLLENIKKRGREYEHEISQTYLEGIQRSYFDFFHQQPELRVLVVDLGSCDFMNHAGDYEILLQLLFQASYQPGINHVKWSS